MTILQSNPSLGSTPGSQPDVLHYTPQLQPSVSMKYIMQQECNHHWGTVGTCLWVKSECYITVDCAEVKRELQNAYLKHATTPHSTQMVQHWDVTRAPLEDRGGKSIYILAAHIASSNAYTVSSQECINILSCACSCSTWYKVWMQSGKSTHVRFMGRISKEIVL